MKQYINKYLFISLGLALSLILVASLRQAIESNAGDAFNPVETKATSPVENTETTPAQTKSINIATYNIARGKGTDGIRDILRTASILKNFDIIGLNEVGGFPFTNQAEQLGKELGLAWLFAANHKRWFYNYFGNGVLSNLPVSGWKSQMLPRDVKKHRAFRNYVVTHFHWQGKELAVITTHLGRGDLVGVQLNQVMREFQQYPHAILMGDFNLKPDDPIWAEQAGQQTYTEADSSMSSTNQLLLGHSERVDYIFLRGLKILDSGHHPRGISDHPLIWAKVALIRDRDASHISETDSK